MTRITNVQIVTSRSFSENEALNESVLDLELVRQIDHLFSLYEPWSVHYPKNFRAFTLIKRIIDVSFSGGLFLSHDEKKKLSLSLEELKEALVSGNLKHLEIPKAVEGILLGLTETNSKAKLVVQTTKIESFILSQLKKDESMEITKNMMQRIISKITPNLPEMNALAIAQELHLLLDQIAKQPEGMKKALPSLEGALKQWL